MSSYQYQHHKMYLLPLLRKTEEDKWSKPRKLGTMLICLYLLLFVGLLLFANASHQLGPWTACREREDVSAAS